MTVGGSGHLPYQSALAAAVDWFESAGVSRWNFCVLDGQGMLGQSRDRDRNEVMKSARWGWAENRNGRNVYLRPARGLDCPVVFLDDLSVRRGLAIARKYSTLVIETSLDNCQIWIRADRSLSEPERLRVQRDLASLIGCDGGSVSGEHFGRAPGYKNRKPGRNDFCARVVAATGGRPLAVGQYLLPSATTIALPQRRSREVGGPVLQPSSGTESHRDFGWCIGRLHWASGAGRDLSRERALMISKLARQALERGKRRDESGAQKYAARTVDAAARKLGLLGLL